MAAAEIPHFVERPSRLRVPARTCEADGQVLERKDAVGGILAGASLFDRFDGSLQCLVNQA